MSFYGTNLSASQRVAFSFDRIYGSRKAMDDSANTDGIVQGRYVFIDYGERPITGYYNTRDQKFYNSPDFTSYSLMGGQADVLYQNINTSIFYRYDPVTKVWVGTTSGDTASYIAGYRTDVANYGRGYDSTVWMKYYDTSSGEMKHKYVCMAELNSISPVFHLFVDPPETLIGAPYFDKETTNVDCYLHIQAPWYDKIRYNDNKSDFAALARDIYWSNTTAGQTFNISEKEEKNLDIYFNKAGLNKEQRSYDNSVENGIGFNIVQSGRMYYDSPNRAGVFSQSRKMDDTREWYVRLPAIGNTMCELFDLTYGYAPSGRRYTALATRKGDPNPLVTYSSNTLIGLINRFKDAVGYNLAMKTSSTPNITYNKNDTTILYYTPGDGTNSNTGMPQKFYAYIYEPEYAQGTLNADKTLTLNDGSQPLASAKLYYHDDVEDLYKIANPNRYNTGDILYAAIDRWVLKELQTPFEDSLYGAILNVTQSVGRDHEIRDDSLYGVRNQLLDVLKTVKDSFPTVNIDYAFTPSLLMATNSNGTVVTTTLEWPYQPTSNVPAAINAEKHSLVISGMSAWTDVADLCFNTTKRYTETEITNYINNFTINVNENGTVTYSQNGLGAADIVTPQGENQPNIITYRIWETNTTLSQLLDNIVKQNYITRKGINVLGNSLSQRITNLNNLLYNNYLTLYDLQELFVDRLQLVTTQQWNTAMAQIRPDLY